MTRQPLGLHLTYRCGHSLFVKWAHAARHQLIQGRRRAANVCAACWAGEQAMAENIRHASAQLKNSAALPGADAAGKTTAPTDALVGGRKPEPLEADQDSSSQSRLGGA